MTAKHSALALLVAVVWGINFVVIDEGLDGVPPLVFLAMRFTAVALPAIFFVRRPTAPWHTVVLIGLFMSFGQFALLYLALHLGLPSGLASLLLQTQVVLTIVVAAVFLREKPGPLQIVGVVIGMGGLAVVIAGHSFDAPFLPVLVVLAGALSWAIGNVISRQAKVSSGLSLVVWSALVIPVPSFALALLVDGPTLVFASLGTLSATAILSTLYTAGVASLIGYGIWNTLMARYPTSKVVPFTLLIPVVGIAAAFVFQGEVPTVSELLGGGIMLAGLAVAVITKSKRGAQSSASRDTGDSIDRATLVRKPAAVPPSQTR